MTLTIEIDLDNAIFEDAGAEEVKRILIDVASRIPDPPTRTLDRCSIHEANGNLPAGMEQVGPFTLVWGRHHHRRVQGLAPGAIAYCPCGAVRVDDPTWAQAGLRWYLPEEQARAAQEAVLDAVLYTLGEPTITATRLEQGAVARATLPAGGVVGESATPGESSA